MTKRRVIAAIIAVVLTIAACVVVVSYTSSADQRAMADLSPRVVLVVTAPIPKGTAAAALTPEMVERKTLPLTAIVPDAVATQDQISGRVAAVDLEPGEQVLSSRFVDPATLSATVAVPVPKGLQQVTIALDNQRVLGGRLVPGNLVGVFVTDTEAKKTHLVISKALVTDVRATGQQQQQSDGAAPQAADSQTVAVTLAVSAHPAERIVWGAVNGAVWLSLQGPKVDNSGNRVTDSGKAVQ